MMIDVFLLSLISLPFLAIPLLLVIEAWGRRAVERVVLSTSTTCLILLILLGNDLDWASHYRAQFFLVPSLDIHLSFIVDGLSLFFACIVTGVGCLIFQYSRWYFGEEEKHLSRFYSYMLFFMGSMLGCLFSNDLILLFIFWEFTALASFLLIGFYHEKPASQDSARMVLMVTISSGLLLLLGILMIGYDSGTFNWFELTQQRSLFKEHYSWYDWALLCCTIGALGKSAQIPFHFWLPRAMEAPTPVSAYLHSATMVKLGVFLIARLYPIFVESSLWLPLLSILCMTTMILGAIFSLLSHNLKTILAYATLSQLGFFIGFYGLGNVEGVRYDFIHILNHSLYKGALFLLVGIVYKATGETNIRHLGRLGKQLPLTAVLFFVAVSAMAGLPGTTGFLSKELILADLVYLGESHSYGYLALACVIFASIFKVAFSIRLFNHIFLAKPYKDIRIREYPPWQMHIAPGLLATIAVVGGVWPGGLKNLVNALTLGHLQNQKPLHLWHGWTVELALSATVILLGVALYRACHYWGWAKLKVPDSFRVDRIFEASLKFLVYFAKKITAWSQPQRSDRILAVVLVTTIGFLGILLWIVSPPSLSNLKVIYETPVTTLMTEFLTVLGAILLVGLFSIGARSAGLMALAAVGVLITLYWVVYHAPDLALTQLLVEAFLFMILLIFIRGMPKEKNQEKRRFFEGVRIGIALCSGIFVFFLLAAIGESWPHQRIGSYFLQQSLPLANGANVVNTILVDFRAFDTLGEIMVLGIACLGGAALLSRDVNKEFLLSDHSVRPLHGRDNDPSSTGPMFYMPSKIFHLLSQLIFWLSSIAALYFFLRGHNAPGGGFIAGLISALSFVMLQMSRPSEELENFFSINPLRLIFWGWTLALFSAILPQLLGFPYLKMFYWKTGGLSWSILFDGGVGLVVIGSMFRILSLLRYSSSPMTSSEKKQLHEISKEES